jgi:thioredoxin 1
MAHLLTDANFSDTLNAGKPVVVDFWAEWCGPCRAVAPVIEELSHEYEGRVTIGKMDVDANPDVPAKYSIRNIPTLLFFKNGELVDKHVGVANKSVLTAKIDALL